MILVMRTLKKYSKLYPSLSYKKKFTTIGDATKQDEYITHLTRLGVSYAYAYRFQLCLSYNFDEISGVYGGGDDEKESIKIVDPFLNEL